jgi:hypothetical protein
MRTLLIISLFFTTQLSSAQVIEAELTSLKSCRNGSSTNSGLEIGIDLPGVEKVEYSKALIEEAYAICENGDTLHLKKAYWQPFFFNGPTAFLELPDRSVNTITSIEGKVKVFVPSEENDSRVLINSRKLRKQNKDILAKYDIGIKMLVLDNTKADAYVDALLPAAKQHILETDELSAEEKEEMLSWWDFIESLARYVPESDQFIQFLIVEEEGDLMELNIYDEEQQSQIGARVSLSTIVDPSLEKLLDIKRFKFKEVNYRAFAFWEVTEDYTLELILQNEASTNVYPFSIQNITLP